MAAPDCLSITSYTHMLDILSMVLYLLVYSECAYSHVNSFSTFSMVKSPLK